MIVSLDNRIITDAQEFMDLCTAKLATGLSQQELCSILAKSGLGEAMAKANASTRDPISGPLTEEEMMAFLLNTFNTAIQLDAGGVLRQALEQLHLRYESIRVRESRYYLTYTIYLPPGVRVSAYRRALPKIEEKLGLPVRMTLASVSLQIETPRPDTTLSEFQMHNPPPSTLGMGTDDKPVCIMPHMGTLIAGDPGTGKSTVLRNIMLAAAQDDILIMHIGKEIRIPAQLGVRCRTWMGSVSEDLAMSIVLHDLRNEMLRRLRNHDDSPEIIVLIDDIDRIIAHWSLTGPGGSDLKNETCSCIAELASRGELAGISLAVTLSSPSSSGLASILACNLPQKVMLKLARKNAFYDEAPAHLDAPGDAILYDEEFNTQRLRVVDLTQEQLETRLESIAREIEMEM